MNKQKRTQLCTIWTYGTHHHRRSEVLKCRFLKIFMMTMYSTSNDVILTNLIVYSTSKFLIWLLTKLTQFPPLLLQWNDIVPLLWRRLFFFLLEPTTKHLKRVRSSAILMFLLCKVKKDPYTFFENKKACENSEVSDSCENWQSETFRLFHRYCSCSWTVGGFSSASGSFFLVLKAYKEIFLFLETWFLWNS